MAKAIITDLTTLGLAARNVCAAVRVASGQIRLNSPQPNETWVEQVGLRPGLRIEVTWQASAETSRPHTEDADWNMRTCSKVDDLSPDTFKQLLERDAYDSVRDAYGEPAVVGSSGSCAFKPGIGKHSLVSLKGEVLAVTMEYEKVRVRFCDSRNEWSHVPLQDLVVNQHIRDCRNCRKNMSASLANEFKPGPAVFRLGLAREHALGSYPPLCWLQVNHIVLGRSPKHFS